MTGLAAAAGLGAPLSVDAQPARTARVGFLEAGSPSANQHFLDAFRQGLRELGYVEGQDVAIETRWAGGRRERFPELLAELVALKPDVLVVASTPAALAARKAALSVPVVFCGVVDPVGLGIVTSLGRPGGNMTGLTLGIEEGLLPKGAELLKEMVPRVSQMAIVWNPESPLEPRVKEVEAASGRLRTNFRAFEVRSADDLGPAFAAIAKARMGGVLVVTDPLTLVNRERIVQLAAQGRLPAVYSFGEFARAGGLMAYGASVPDLFRRAAIYVDKILRGAKPADLPVEQPTKFELVINMRTARSLNLAVPQALLLRADQVIGAAP